MQYMHLFFFYKALLSGYRSHCYAASSYLLILKSLTAILLMFFKSPHTKDWGVYRDYMTP